MSRFEDQSIQADAAATLEFMLKRIEFDENEIILTQNLKALCDDKGKETDLQASAPLLRKLGKVYHKRAVYEPSPNNMFCVIKSAVLYNAASLRDLKNKQTVQADLQHLCSHILILADADNKTALLTGQAEIVKQAVLEMRERVIQRLKQIKAIPDYLNDEESYDLRLDKILQLKNQITQKLHDFELEKITLLQHLQNQITNDFKQIMANLARFCEEVMGPAPCKFALTGMGSLARSEVTPYSDFENIILLDNKINTTDKNSYEKILQYFRWFSVIFQIVLVNLQETIIPSVAIASLNWFYDDNTRSGISFDGMMPHACKFPLGRQQHTKNKPFATELIKPVDEMLKYLSSEENLKNGYHLSDILTKTCFVYKDKDLFDEFENGVFEMTESEQNRKNVLKEVTDQVIEDLQSFATRFSLSELESSKPFNMKRIIYRSTTLFISALGRLHNIRASSCFDIIAKLHMSDDEEHNKYAKHKLMYAVALACEIRLRWYMKRKKQSDSIDSVQILTELVGKRSAISYFQIAYALQGDLSKRLELKRNHFYTSPSLLNLRLGHCLNDQNYVLRMLRRQKRANLSQRLLDFDKCLTILEEQTAETFIVSKQISKVYSTDKTTSIWKQLQKLGLFMFRANAYDDAVEFFRQSTELLQHQLMKEKTNCDSLAKKMKSIASNYRRIGCSLTCLQKNQEALSYYENALKILCSLPATPDVALEVANTLGFRGWTKTHANLWKNFKLLESAKKDLLSSIVIMEIISADVDCNYVLSQTYENLGTFYKKTDKLDEANKYLKRGLKMKELISVDIETDRSLAAAVGSLGHCLTKLNQHEEAKLYFTRALEIAIRSSHDLDSDRLVSSALNDINYCLLMKEQKTPVELEQAREFSQKSLEIEKQTAIDANTDSSISYTKSLLTYGQLGLKISTLQSNIKFKVNQSKAVKPFNPDLNLAHPSLKFKSNSGQSSKVGVKTQLFEGTKLIERSKKMHEILKEATKESEKIQLNTAIIPRKIRPTLSYLGKNFLSSIETSSKSFHSLSFSPDVELEVPFLYRSTDGGWKSIHLSLLGDFLGSAREDLLNSMAILKQVSSEIDCRFITCQALEDLGYYFVRIDKFTEAKKYFNRSLEIKELISVDTETDHSIASVMKKIGKCLTKLNEHEKSKLYFSRALQIAQRSKSDRAISFALRDLGCCMLQKEQIEINEMEMAKGCFLKSLQIWRRISLEGKHSFYTCGLMAMCDEELRKHKKPIRYRPTRLRPNLAGTKIRHKVSSNKKLDSKFEKDLKNHPKVEAK